MTKTAPLNLDQLKKDLEKSEIDIACEMYAAMIKSELFKESVFKKFVEYKKPTRRKLFKSKLRRLFNRFYRAWLVIRYDYEVET